MSNPFYVHVGNAVRRRRESIAMTQAALAAQVGLSRTTITNIEAGRQALLFHQAVAIASALQLQSDALVPLNPTGPSEADVEHEDNFKDLLSKLSAKRSKRGASK